MVKSLINPNLHVILIHYPLGVLVLGTTIELLSFLWRDSTVRAAARWMILLGALATLPAVMTGIYALWQAGDGAMPSGARHDMLLRHLVLESGATAFALIVAVVGLGVSDASRRKFYPILLGGMAVAIGLMGVGAWFGGETIYQHGTGVLIAPDRGSSNGDASDAKPLEGLYYYVGNPLQIHLILVSGILICATVGMGLAVRKITSSPDPDAPAARTRDYDDLSLAHSFPPETAPVPIKPIPVVRFWLFAALFVALTSAAGAWYWAHDGSYSLRTFWQQIMVVSDNGREHLAWDRRSAHVWAGASILVTILILAAVGQWAHRRRALLGAFVAVLVLLVAAQFWLGILLAFSGSEGSIYRFRGAAARGGAESPADTHWSVASR